jgi:hypothetical protein
MKDQDEADISGTGAFTGLKSAVFPASTLTEAEQETIKSEK